MDIKELPVRASLEQYKKQAKDLINAFKLGDLETMRCIRQHHPRLPGRANTNDRNCVSDSEIRSAGVTLADAQSVVARWHGFESWPKLTKHIEALTRKNSPVLQFELGVEAIITGDVATLKLLLRADPELIRRRSTREHQATHLHYVGANGVEGYRQKTPKNIVEITKLLLAAGAQVNAESDAYAGRSTTLGLTATSWHPEKAGVQLRYHHFRRLQVLFE